MAFEVVAAGLGSHPDFMQGFLQIQDDLTAVGKAHSDHASRALVVDIGFSVVIDTITTALDGRQKKFSLIQEFKVGHYNPVHVEGLFNFSHPPMPCTLYGGFDRMRPERPPQTPHRRILSRPRYPD
jgi:hypothetical protein